MNVKLFLDKTKVDKRAPAPRIHLLPSLYPWQPFSSLVRGARSRQPLGRDGQAPPSPAQPRPAGRKRLSDEYRLPSPERSAVGQQTSLLLLPPHKSTHIKVVQVCYAVRAECRVVSLPSLARGRTAGPNTKHDAWFVSESRDDAVRNTE